MPFVKEECLQNLPNTVMSNEPIELQNGGSHELQNGGHKPTLMVPGQPGKFCELPTTSASPDSPSTSRRPSKESRPSFVAPPLFDFSDKENIKKEARERLKPKEPYNVFVYYKETGFWQWLAKHQLFESVTLFVISLNAVWMAVDTDYNDADALLKAHPFFFWGENLFCAYFTFEWFTRFMAFDRKCNGLRDAWFVFDSLLVFLMVMETWILVILVGDGPSPLGNTAVLRLFRLLRLSRLIRMLRSLPELMILIKGMVSAMKSVVYVMLLLVMLTYVFAIACKQLSVGTEYHEEYFNTVSVSMFSLIIYATFLDDLGPFMDAIRVESPGLVFVLGIFIVLSALTVMNMLVGVLCAVVDSVAVSEREDMLVDQVKQKLAGILAELDVNNNGEISYQEFKKILEIPDALKTLQEVDVDPIGMLDFGESFFAPDGVPEELSFDKFMEMVLDLRSTNTATVKDLMNMNLQMSKRLDGTTHCTQGSTRRIARVEKDIVAMRRSTERLEKQLKDALAEVRHYTADLPSDTLWDPPVAKELEDSILWLGTEAEDV
eukprot:TRINITY_DN2651_c0_g5_i2.p1 TRINITY_DN2651_c0_g5~~TRINITY_DN2651_c0_g5_i2.p1  ORF type:complete len:548 (+),score=136.47 TRINITY_DN2651_c0_g5_i2:109-1752(+)